MWSLTPGGFFYTADEEAHAVSFPIDKTKMLATYLVDAEQSTEKPVVFLAKFLHLSVARVRVTFRSGYLLLDVEITGPCIHGTGCFCQFRAETRVVLVGEQTGSVAGFDIAAHHLHFLGGHLERAERDWGLRG